MRSPTRRTSAGANIRARATATAVTCGVATGADTGTLPVSRRTARADMAFMLCRNGGGCQRFNPESQVFAHVGGRPRVKEKPPAPPRDRQPLLRERARAQKPDLDRK